MKQPHRTAGDEEHTQLPQDPHRIPEHVDEQAAKLRRASRLREAIFDAMTEAVVVYDTAGHPIMANPSAVRMFGCDPNGKPLADLMCNVSLRHLDGTPVEPDDFPPRSALDGEEVKGKRYRCTTPAGEDVAVLTSAVPLFEDGEIIGAVAVSTDISEEAMLLGELASERALLDALIDCAPVGIVLTDAEAHIVRTNRTADALYAHPVPLGEGYESHARLLMLRENGSLYPPRDLPLTRAALDGVETRNKEMLIRWPDGQQRDLLVHTAPVLRNGGSVTGAVGVFQDISERKQEQRVLRRYADRFATLRNIDRMILSASSEVELGVGVIPQIRGLLGCDHLSLAKNLGEGEFEILAFSTRPQDRGPQDSGAHNAGPDAAGTSAFTRGRAVNASAVEALSQGQMITIEDLAAVPDPPAFRQWLLGQGVRALTVAPLRANGELMGTLIAGMCHPGYLCDLREDGETKEILRDIADQLAIGLRQLRLYAQISSHAVQLEWIVAQRTAALQASEASFRAVFEQAAAGIFTADLQGWLTRHNAALSRMLGAGQHRLEGLALRDLDHPEDRAEAQARFERLAAGETPDYQVEQRYVREDGSEMVGRLTVSLVREADQSPAFAVGILEDITDEKLAHEALLQAEKLSVTGQLVAAVTHEINNPLQTVLGCMGLLQESLEENGQGQANPYLTMSMQELRRISMIMGELRDLHRKTNPEDRELTNLGDLVTHVVQLAAYQAEERDVNIRWSPPEGPAVVLPLVAARLHQVFLNLIFNAIDAMPDGGEIQIEMKRTTQPPGASLVFKDTGTGIPQDLMPHLFQPFQTTKTTGMGMGLYICRSIVHEHGGQIDVESTPGRGSTFTIWLPRPVAK